MVNGAKIGRRRRRRVPFEILLGRLPFATTAATLSRRLRCYRRPDKNEKKKKNKEPRRHNEKISAAADYGVIRDGKGVRGAKARTVEGNEFKSTLDEGRDSPRG